MLILTVINGPSAGRVYEVADDQSQTIGRGAPLLRLKDSRISREHARVRVENGQWVLEDLDSANGTYINRKRIGTPVGLRSGDRLHIGRIKLVVSKAEVAAGVGVGPRQPQAKEAAGAATSRMHESSAGEASMATAMGLEATTPAPPLAAEPEDSTPMEPPMEPSPPREATKPQLAPSAKPRKAGPTLASGELDEDDVLSLLGDPTGEATRLTLDEEEVEAAREEAEAEADTADRERVVIGVDVEPEAADVPHGAEASDDDGVEESSDEDRAFDLLAGRTPQEIEAEAAEVSIGDKIPADGFGADDSDGLTPEAAVDTPANNADTSEDEPEEEDTFDLLAAALTAYEAAEAARPPEMRDEATLEPAARLENFEHEGEDSVEPDRGATDVWNPGAVQVVQAAREPEAAPGSVSYGPVEIVSPSESARGEELDLADRRAVATDLVIQQPVEARDQDLVGEELPPTDEADEPEVSALEPVTVERPEAEVESEHRAQADGSVEEEVEEGLDAAVAAALADDEGWDDLDSLDDLTADWPEAVIGRSEEVADEGEREEVEPNMEAVSASTTPPAIRDEREAAEEVDVVEQVGEEQLSTSAEDAEPPPGAGEAMITAATPDSEESEPQAHQAMPASDALSRLDEELADLDDLQPSAALVEPRDDAPGATPLPERRATRRTDDDEDDRDYTPPPRRGHRSSRRRRWVGGLTAVLVLLATAAALAVLGEHLIPPDATGRGSTDGSQKSTALTATTTATATPRTDAWVPASSGKPAVSAATSPGVDDRPTGAASSPSPNPPSAFASLVVPVRLRSDAASPAAVRVQTLLDPPPTSADPLPADPAAPPVAAAASHRVEAPPVPLDDADSDDPPPHVDHTALDAALDEPNRRAAMAGVSAAGVPVETLTVARTVDSREPDEPPFNVISRRSDTGTADARPAPADVKARKVAYLIDASGSMIDTLPDLVEHVIATLDDGQGISEFTVIFFRGDETLEAPPAGLKPMDRKATRTAIRWMQDSPVSASGRSDAARALQLAAGYGVDEIVILSDGSFGRGSATGPAAADAAIQNVVQALRSADRDVTLSSVQFFYDDPDAILKRLAQQHGGTFQLIQSAAARRDDDRSLDLDG